jgi:hypothetical protein
MTDRTEQQSRWLQAVEQGVFGVWDLAPLLEMVYYSPSWKARFGFPRIHAPDSTGFWRARVHPDDFESMRHSLRLHLDGHATSYEMRFRLRSNGSGYRTVLSRGRVVARDESGRATRMAGTMVDLTGRPISAAQGLAAEEPEPSFDWPGVPLHVALGLADVANEAQLLVEAVSDLLDMALHEASATSTRSP